MTPEEESDETFLDPDEEMEYGEWNDDTEDLESDDLPDYDREAL